MKKLLTIVVFCMINNVVLFAQESKPTKEETVAFIKSYFADRSINLLCEMENGSLRDRTYSKFLVESRPESNMITIKWQSDLEIIGKYNSSKKI